MKKSMKHTSLLRGFTIVELMVVIVVIAILAVIAFVSYNGIQNQARASALISDVRQIGDSLKLATADTNGLTPASLTNLDVSVPSKYTAEYWRYDNNRAFCVSYSLTGNTSVKPYHVASYKKDTSPQPGACSDAESAADGFLGYSSSASAPGAFDATDPFGDFTAYVAFEVSSMDAAWSSMAASGNAATTGKFQFDQSSAGSNVLRIRIDTSVSTNFTLSQGGVRTNGRHLGWMQVSDNATKVALAYDQTGAYASGTLPTSTGFTLTNMRLASASAGMLPLATAIYDKAHTDKERSHVLQWLAKKFSIPGTF